MFSSVPVAFLILPVTVLFPKGSRLAALHEHDDALEFEKFPADGSGSELHRHRNHCDLHCNADEQQKDNRQGRHTDMIGPPSLSVFLRQGVVPSYRPTRVTPRPDLGRGPQGGGSGGPTP
jgi:hypothetical protein